MSDGNPSFEDLGLAQFLIRNCRALKITQPTLIQSKTIPRILQGDDVIGRAKTGSGKTAAFALPILHKLSEDPFGVFALVLTPTRELAFQISEQFSVLSSTLNLQTCVIVGGQDKMKESVELGGRPHIVVATPGRLSDHIRSGTKIHFRHLKFLVLDEADRMLEPTFDEDLKTIFSVLPPPARRQNLMFSATLTDSMQQIRDLSTKKTAYFEAASDSMFSTVESVEQSFLFVPRAVKECYLVYLLREQFESLRSVIVFVSTKAACQVLAEQLLHLEIDCVTLHSNINQARRLAALGKFRAGVSRILIATDVASRGLDIPTVDCVVNFDVPRDTTDYVHRIGRTARAERAGTALTIVSQYEVELFYAVEKLVGKKIEQFELDGSEDDVLANLREVSAAKRTAKLKLEQYGVDLNASKKTKASRDANADSGNSEKDAKRKKKKKDRSSSSSHRKEVSRHRKKSKKSKAKKL